MRSKSMHITLKSVLASLALLAASQIAAAQHETILWDFSGSTGGGPQAGVILDSSGNIFGTADKAIYELSPAGGGTYTPNTLYTVTGSSVSLEGDPVLDSQGNLYSVTQGCCRNVNTVLKLTPGAGGTWTPTTIYTFPDTGTHGYQPYGGPVFDTSGNLYGTSNTGGAYGTTNSGGTVYELSPLAGGGWSQKVLHSFGNGTDGAEPYAGVIFDSAGNLYGTTTQGGTLGFGIVFELIHQTGGAWREEILHNFTGALDGANPYAGVTFDSLGNLYGATTGGGAHSGGVVFELIHQSGATWKDKVLHAFGNSGDGSYIPGAPVFDSAGNLYGTTFFGGSHGGGIAFKLAPQANGSWSETVLHNFSGGRDGAGSLGGLAIDGSGNLFGTTQSGGAASVGTVFLITP